MITTRYYRNPNSLNLGAILSFNRTDAIKRALHVVNAGLENGCITLQVSSSYEENNRENSKRDADYLNNLINPIAENISMRSEGN
jgi:hypothetical protein